MTTTIEGEEYMRGATDAFRWAPRATEDELTDMLENAAGKHTLWIYPDHTLAAVWAGTDSNPSDGPVGDVDPWSAYGRGFYDGLVAAFPEPPASSHQCVPPALDDLKHGARWRCTCTRTYVLIRARSTDGQLLHGWLKP